LKRDFEFLVKYVAGFHPLDMSHVSGMIWGGIDGRDMDYGIRVVDARPSFLYLKKKIILSEA